jgi:hypothetical protein
MPGIDEDHMTTADSWQNNTTRKSARLSRIPTPCALLLFFSMNHAEWRFAVIRTSLLP